MRRVLVFLIGLAGCERGNRDTPPAPQAAEHPATATQARIVSLTPSATEVVAALGATASLVGVDDYSKFPESVASLPKVGSFIAPNLETIVRLKPTLVIVDDIHGQAAGALHDAGITTIECAMHALPDVKSALLTIGARLGKVQAEAAIAAIDASLDDAAAHKPARHPRVLAVIDREAGGLGHIVAAGPGSWIDELVAVVGGDNVLAGAPTRYPNISIEEVLRTKPDIILDLSFAAHEGTAAWQQVDVPAVKTKHIVVLGDDVFAHPSPRVAEAVAALAKAIR